ncbi:MAG: hypothetical protein LBT79_01740 [Elusimicrobiota bacterium]|jgi:hypothetical protein|nr:hypothetical protein [Elusimicrobiota bacterium]
MQIEKTLKKIQKIYPESYLQGQKIIVEKRFYSFLILENVDEKIHWWLSQDGTDEPICSTSNIEHILGILKIIKETEK